MLYTTIYLENQRYKFVEKIKNAKSKLTNTKKIN